MSYPADYPQKLLCKQNIVIASNKYFCDHEWYGKNSTDEENFKDFLKWAIRSQAPNLL